MADGASSSPSPMSRPMSASARRSTAKPIARGNSTYFPDRVSPMLPEHLSADLCSLKEGELRETFAVEIFFNAGGHKTKHRFIRGKMRSAAKLSYRQAQDAIDGKPDDKTGPLLETVLKPLWEAYRTVAQGPRPARAAGPRPARAPRAHRRGRQDRLDQPARAFRRAPPDRRVHDPGQRLRRRNAGGQAHAAGLSRARGAERREGQQPLELPADHRPEMDARREDHRPDASTSCWAMCGAPRTNTSSTRWCCARRRRPATPTRISATSA